MKKYIDLLAVQTPDGKYALVVAEAHLVHENDLVEFDGGELGRVLAKAWAGERDGELHTLIAGLQPAYEAEAVYSENWRQVAPEGQTDDA